MPPLSGNCLKNQLFTRQMYKNYIKIIISEMFKARCNTHTCVHNIINQSLKDNNINISKNVTIIECTSPEYDRLYTAEKYYMIKNQIFSIKRIYKK